MDKRTQRRSTLAVQTAPSQTRPASYHHPTPASPNRSASLRHRSNNKTDRPLPASLARVKGTIAMDTPPPTGMSWLKDQSPMSETPGTPRSSRTPEPGTTSLVNPSSALLQDLLKEQRATRGSRGTASEDCDEYAPRTPDRCRSRAHSRSLSHSQTQSQEDTSSEKKRKVDKALSAGLRQPREMGVREMDQYISKMNKQNFDLKLEIFHRIQQMGTLEKKLERMEELEEEVERMRGLEDELQELRDAEEDNQRLRESNEQLRQELDKRDQAVTEAVDLICQLEARVEELEGGDLSRPSTARPDTSDGPGPAVTSPQLPPTVDIPERTSSKRGTTLGKHRQVSSDSCHIQRAPSFLHDVNTNTAALRSLYVPRDDGARSAVSVMTKTESLQSMNEITEPDSPRLSALSECSDLVPSETPTEQAFDQLEIPLRNEGLSTRSSSETSRVNDKETIRNQRIDQWMEPESSIYPEKGSKRRNRVSLDVLQATGNASLEREFYLNGSEQKTRLRLDAVYGGSRLPPTPDTMSTAYAVGKNGSDGSIRERRHAKRRLGRPRSLNELTARRNSANSDMSDGMQTNLSERTHHRTSIDEGDEIPAISPLNGVALDEHIRQGSPDRIGFRYYNGDAMLNGEAIRKVLSKMEKNHYSNAYDKESVRTDLSASPPLTPQDWIEAAKSKPRSRKERGRGAKSNGSIKTQNGPTPVDARLVGRRAPSQSSFLARRHSMDSTVRDRDTDIPPVPILDLRSLDPIPAPSNSQPSHTRTEPAPEPESRRRLSFRPFFGRSLGNSRRLQPSPMPDSADPDDDGAPSPVIRKTRNMAHTKLNTTDFSNSMSAYPESSARENFPKTLPHSFTESNLWPQGNAGRPTTPNSKEHKRRGSLGIFGWMKGASNIVSSSKKQEPNSPTHPLPALPKERTSSRLANERPGTAHENDNPTPSTNTNAAANTKVGLRTEDEEQSRRPRYMDRRSRRT